jgi:hypothetical protein
MSCWGLCVGRLPQSNTSHAPSDSHHRSARRRLCGTETASLAIPADRAVDRRRQSLMLPPVPIPDRLRGQKFGAVFVIDERGGIESIMFTVLDDREYSRRLMTVLRATKFSPALKPDGNPSRGYYIQTWTLGPM